MEGMTVTDTATNEHNYFVELANNAEINAPWLENKSMEIEQALIERMGDTLPGPSVTANFEINGFELDLTVVAPSRLERDRVFSEAMSIVEAVGGICVGNEADDTTEIRSGYQGSLGDSQNHGVGAYA